MEDSGVRAAAKLTQLRGRIERWRRTRVTRSPMPAELWMAATELARGLGVSRVARELRIGYGALKERLRAVGESGREGAAAFVAVDGAALFAPPPASGRGEVELSDAGGLKVVIRLPAGQTVDWAALVAAVRTTGR
jgi:hypothetical protein